MLYNIFDERLLKLTLPNGQKIEASEIFINERTGERLKAHTVVKRVERSGFEITYLAYLYDLFDALGNKKMQIFKFILENKDSENKLIITTRELAEHCEVALSTAHETLKILEKKGLIKRRSGSLMVIPKIAHKGDKGREKNLMIKFKEFD